MLKWIKKFGEILKRKQIRTIFSQVHYPLLFRSYVWAHLLTLSNSFLAFFSSLLLLSQAFLTSCCPTPKLQMMILVWYFTVMSRTSCPCCRRGAKPTAPAWMQRGLSPSLGQASQTGFRLFAHKCCSPTHTSVCTPRVHSSGFMKCRYSHQQNLHTLPALWILMCTKETLEIPRKGTF